MARQNVLIEMVEKRGEHTCVCGHKVGDVFDFQTERGKLCSVAMNALYPYISALRFGAAELPVNPVHGDFRYCCPDPEVGNVFRLSVK